MNRAFSLVFFSDTYAYPAPQQDFNVDLLSQTQTIQDLLTQTQSQTIQDFLTQTQTQTIQTQSIQTLCSQSSFLTDVPNPVTLISTNKTEKWGGETLGNYYQLSDFTVNGYPVYKHENFELYFSYNAIGGR